MHVGVPAPLHSAPKVVWSKTRGAPLDDLHTVSVDVDKLTEQLPS